MPVVVCEHMVVVAVSSAVKPLYSKGKTISWNMCVCVCVSSHDLSDFSQTSGACPKGESGILSARLLHKMCREKSSELFCSGMF